MRESRSASSHFSELLKMFMWKSHIEGNICHSEVFLRTLEHVWNFNFTFFKSFKDLWIMSISTLISRYHSVAEGAWSSDMVFCRAKHKVTWKLCLTFLLRCLQRIKILLPSSMKSAYSELCSMSESNGLECPTSKKKTYKYLVQILLYSTDRTLNSSKERNSSGLVIIFRMWLISLRHVMQFISLKIIWQTQ